MGKADSLFGAVRRVFRHESKEKKTQVEDQRIIKHSKRKWWGFGRLKHANSDTVTSPESPTVQQLEPPSLQSPLAPPSPEPPLLLSPPVVSQPLASVPPPLTPPLHAPTPLPASPLFDQPYTPASPPLDPPHTPAPPLLDPPHTPAPPTPPLLDPPHTPSLLDSPPPLTQVLLDPPPLPIPALLDPLSPTVSELVHLEHEYRKDIYAATLVAVEAAATAAKAAAEVVRLTAGATKFSGIPRGEAATKIQTTFRGYMARKALQELRILVRLESVLKGDSVKRQTRNALHSMQVVTKIQAELRSRRIKMAEENQDFKRLLQLKRERELETLRTSTGEEWDASLLSKEKAEANIMRNYDAAIRRERALAYAFSHQWKSSWRSVNPMFTDLNNPRWGWSWLERWMAANQSSTEEESSSVGEAVSSPAQRELTNRRSSPVAKKYNQPGSHRFPSTPPSNLLSRGTTREEIIHAYPQMDVKHSQPGRYQFPSTPPSKTFLKGMVRSGSPRVNYLSEDDTRSIFSIRSELHWRPNMEVSSTRDDDSLASSPAIPNYMASTTSTRAKARYKRSSSNRIITRNRASLSSARKQLHFPASQNSRSSGKDILRPFEHTNNGRRR